jgi:neutral ceramidase
MTGAAKHCQAGAGRVEITPPLDDVPYLNFRPRHSPFSSVHDPLYVRSVVVSGGKKRAVVISAEAIGFINTVLGEERNFTAEVRSGIREATGIPAEAVMLTAAHVHSSPDTLDIRPLRDSPGAKAWLESLIQKIVLSVELAAKNTFPVRLKLGRGELAGFSKNRRGANCLDNSVTVLLFESPDGRRRIVLVNYACHPVIVQAQEEISADYVGLMTSRVEWDLPGTEACLFLQGACGDINPWIDDTRNFADVDKMGTALAQRVKGIYYEISAPQSFVEPVIINYASQFVSLPSRPLPTPEEARAFENADNRLWLLDELEARRREGDGPYPAEVQVIRFGNAIIAGIPGEPFCGMGMAIRDLARPFTGVPVGYANGYVGYIVPPEEWRKGGYETEPGPWSKVGTASYRIILRAFERLKTRV